MKSINLNAPVKCSKKITIHSGSKKVWDVLTNIDNWETWQTDISKSKLIGTLKPKSTFHWKSSGANIHSTLHTVEPNSRFGWEGKSFGMHAIHNWVLTDLDDKTIVEVDESMEGFLPRLFKKTFNKTVEKSMQRWLDLLKQECEKQ